MGSWSDRGQNVRGIRLLECFMVVYVFGACCTGSFGKGRYCPRSIITNDTRLQIVSRTKQSNQTEGAYCGANLETMCFRDPEFDNCRILLNLSVSLVAEGDRLVKSFKYYLLQALPVAGKRWDISCKVASLANDRHSSDKVWNVNFWLDYDCCNEVQSQELYASRLEVFYNKSASCVARTPVRLKPESKEVNSPVNTVMPKSSANTSAESSVKGDLDLPKQAASLVGVVVAVVIAVVAAVVTIVVIYIVFVKCSDRRRSYDRANSQSEHTPFNPETHEDCPSCKYDKVKVIAPEDCGSYSTIDMISVIPTIIFPPSDEELTEEQLDSGCFESLLTDMTSIVKEEI